MRDEYLFLKNISFGYDKEIFKDFSINFPIGKVSVILGSSGCGKTSLLSLISGLLSPSEGSIIFKKETGSLKNLAFIFQEPRLLPWRTLSENIELILKRNYNSIDRKEITKKYLEIVGLKDKIDSYPSSLSGGMKQRVSIARAFAHPSDIILMDEPFQAIDLKLKIELMQLFTKLWIDDKRTAILVTHDINEAVLLSDEIFVLSDNWPVKIIDHIKNIVPHTERHLQSDNLIKIRKKLYRIITDDN